MADANTATRLLDSAQRMVQRQGFNNFSYADLASEIGIRSASIHYHFKSKVDLGEALIQRYLERLNDHLRELEQQETSPTRRLELLIEVYRQTERNGHICLCGSLASDAETLPDAMRRPIAAYFARTEAWVAEQIESGVEQGELKPITDVTDLAAMLTVGLQGALIAGRAGGSAPLDSVQRTFFCALGRPN